MRTCTGLVLIARVAVAVLLVRGAAQAQSPRLFWGEFELVGPIEHVTVLPLRGGQSEIELDLAEGERRVLELPVPLQDVVDLEFGDGPRIEVAGSGTARFMAWSPAPRLARVPRVLTALARPVVAASRPDTPWPAGLVALAATIVCVAVARRSGAGGTDAEEDSSATSHGARARAIPLVAAAVIGAAAAAAAVRLGSVEPTDVTCIDRLFVHATLEQSPRLLQRALRGAWLTTGDWRGVLETEPVGAALDVRAELGADGLSVAIEAPGAALLVLEALMPASGGPGDPWAVPGSARRSWRDELGRWFEVHEDGTLTQGLAPERAFASAGLPLGRSALVAVDDDLCWRVLDLPRERAADLDRP